MFFRLSKKYCVFAKTQYSCITTGLEVYESDSIKTMWDSCNTILSEMNASLLGLGLRAYKAELAHNECFFAACILYMVSRASMIAKQSSLEKDDISFEILTNTDGAVRKSLATEIKLLDLLFHLIGYLSRYSLFEEIDKIVNIRYNEHRHGRNLMDFVHFCLFKERLITKHFTESVEDMELVISSGCTYSGL